MTKSITALAVGDKIKFGSFNGQRLVWQIGVKDVTQMGRINASVNPPTENGCLLICCDRVAAMEYNASNAGSTGQGHWDYSSIPQWLNASGAGWYTPRWGSQRAPSYESWDGFLTGFSQNEYQLLISDGIGEKVIIPWVRNCKPGGRVDTDQTAAISGNGIIYPSGALENMPQSDNVADSEKELTMSQFRVPNQWGVMEDHYAVINATGRAERGLVYGAVKSGYGIRPICFVSSAARVSDTVDADGCYTVIFNTPPTVPGNINIPQTVKGGRDNLISWGRSYDPDGDTIGYKLERQITGGEWMQIYNGGLLTYTDSGIAYGTSGSVKWRVKAYDIYGDESAYTVSGERTIINNRPPVISGTDGSMGTFGEISPVLEYVITDADNDPVNVVVKIDGATVQTFDATLGQTYSVTFDSAAWLRTLDGNHSITITATDGTENAVRTKTFIKNVRRAVFETTAFEIEGNDAPLRVGLSVAMSLPTGSSPFIYVANNGNDDEPTWEDCTAQVKAGVAHNFTNTEKTAGSWAVKIRVELYDFTADIENVNLTANRDFIANVLEYLGGESGDITISSGNVTVGGESAGTAANWGLGDLVDGGYSVVVIKAVSPVYIASIQGSTNKTTA